MIRIFMAVFLVVVCSSITAATGILSGVKVDRILLSGDNLYGGCMARLSKPIASTGLDCPDSWVSFSCTGEFSSKTEAQRLLSGAQLAYVSGNDVLVAVTDSFKHNGYCVAYRLDNR
jgi:hypothetical protein